MYIQLHQESTNTPYQSPRHAGTTCISAFPDCIFLHIEHAPETVFTVIPIPFFSQQFGPCSPYTLSTAYNEPCFASHASPITAVFLADSSYTAKRARNIHTLIFSLASPAGNSTTRNPTSIPSGWDNTAPGHPSFPSPKFIVSNDWIRSDLPCTQLHPLAPHTVIHSSPASRFTTTYEYEYDEDNPSFLGSAVHILPTPQRIKLIHFHAR